VNKLQTLTSGRKPPTDGFPYTEKYCAFIDMLGFRSLVEAADTSVEQRVALAEIVGVFRTTIGSHEALGTRISHFSDSLIVSATRSDQGLYALLSGCTWLAINLVQYAVLLRGGIAIGGIAHEPDILFGIAVNRAYAFDRSGLPPRIGLDPNVVSDIDRSPTLSAHNFVTQDHRSGQPMLHFLREIECYDAKLVPGGISWNRHAADIAQIIRIYSNADRPHDVREKYVWLGEYWNRAVARMGILPKV
jgi:hypothetical protein